MERFITPQIPEWIKGIRHPGYKNIFEFSLGNRNLWGTETLLGDWNGKFLFIAKDFYPAAYIRSGIENSVPNPYRHKDGIPTNRNLLKTLKYFSFLGDTFENSTCNILYISACFLLRDDDKIRGGLPDEEIVLSKSAPVLKFTIDNMPNVESVVSMGAEALRALELPSLRSVIDKKGLQTFNVNHPARAMSDPDRFGEWTAILG
jgi:hypothetical protein